MMRLMMSEVAAVEEYQYSTNYHDFARNYISNNYSSSTQGSTSQIISFASPSSPADDLATAPAAFIDFLGVGGS